MSETAAKYQEEQLEIPENIYVNCPLHGDNFPLVNIKKYCIGCSHNEGFFKRDYGDRQVPFEKQYSVKCALPVSRQITGVID